MKNINNNYIIYYSLIFFNVILALFAIIKMYEHVRDIMLKLGYLLLFKLRQLFLIRYIWVLLLL